MRLSYFISFILECVKDLLKSVISWDKEEDQEEYDNEEQKEEEDENENQEIEAENGQKGGVK